MSSAVAGILPSFHSNFKDQRRFRSRESRWGHITRMVRDVSHHPGVQLLAVLIPTSKLEIEKYYICIM